MIAGIFEYPARLLDWFYALTGSYFVAIALVSVVVMAIVTPLTLKATKGMLEMQRLAPEMRKLQNEYRNDRTKLNEEMMKLYQEHKVNPMSSCLPLLAQMPVFLIMFRILYGLTFKPHGAGEAIGHAVYAAAGSPRGEEIGFLPRYLDYNSELFQSLVGQHEMNSLGLDLALRPAEALSDGLGKGLLYIGIVALLGGLYFVQQRMVAARAAVNPTMSPTQQKIMQYLPVGFAIFQVFFILGLVVYYISQAILRIAQQAYITRAFYGHDEAIGRQAQRAGQQARELADADGGGGGLFAQAKRDLAAARGGDSNGAKGAATGAKSTKSTKSAKPTSNKSTRTTKTTAASNGASDRRPNKRTTAPKNRPTPRAGSANSRANRPGGSRRGNRKRR